jgi:nucleoside-diphosphate-sugar epimerase
MELAQCDSAIGRTVNIGSGSEISVGDVVNLIGRLMQIDVQIESDEIRLRPENSEVERLLCDNTLIKELTGYSPHHSLEDGLAATIAWFREPLNLARYKANLYNV